MCAAVGEVCPGLDLAAIRWDMPLQSVGFFSAVAAQRRGNKVVGRRAPTVKLMDRLHVLMDARLAEYKANA